MSKHAASDLHLKADTPAKFRLKGAIRNSPHEGMIDFTESIRQLVDKDGFR
jgi:Tfp pilus assembly pilus retraction ATPase PilT